MPFRARSRARRSLAWRHYSVPGRWIRGNGEREVAAAVGRSAPVNDDLAARTAAITAAEIGEERARALGELPLTLELDGVLFCHASPRRDDEMLTRLSCPSVGPTRWERSTPHSSWPATRTSRTTASSAVRASSTPAASAYRMRATVPHAGCGLLTVSPNCAHTPYDAARAGARILASGWPDERSVAAALVEPVEPSVVTRIFEGLAAG
jgi:hypothetical protein